MLWNLDFLHKSSKIEETPMISWSTSIFFYLQGNQSYGIFPKKKRVLYLPILIFVFLKKRSFDVELHKATNLEES